MIVIDQLIEQLIDRSIQLLQHRNERRQKFLKEFLDPFMDDFEKIHEDYISTFTAIRQTILSSDNTVYDDKDEIFNRLYTDSLFSHGRRKKLLEIANVLDERNLSNLIQAVYKYMGTTAIEYKPHSNASIISRNVRRDRLGSMMLRKMLEYGDKSVFGLQRGSVKQELLDDVDGAIASIEEEYGNVMREFAVVRREYME